MSSIATSSQRRTPSRRKSRTASRHASQTRRTRRIDRKRRQRMTRKARAARRTLEQIHQAVIIKISGPYTAAVVEVDVFEKIEFRRVREVVAKIEAGSVAVLYNKRGMINFLLCLA